MELPHGEDVVTLIHELLRHQMKHIHEMTDPKAMIDGQYHHEWSDDGWDYMTGALHLANDLLHMTMDYTNEAAREKLEVMFNPDGDDFLPYACDGIANEIYDYVKKLHPTYEV